MENNGICGDCKALQGIYDILSDRDTEISLLTERFDLEDPSLVDNLQALERFKDLVSEQTRLNERYTILLEEAQLSEKMVYIPSRRVFHCNDCSHEFED
ncbi:hypothetical protein K8R33_04660 [archaeon]|nr:hypothetical protein [archaeon]